MNRHGKNVLTINFLNFSIINMDKLIQHTACTNRIGVDLQIGLSLSYLLPCHLPKLLLLVRGCVGE